jgi:predicted MPP superfamily phosphohydrolase
LKRIDRRIKIGVIIVAIVLLLGVFFYWQNNSIEVSRYDYSNSKVPSDFVGFKIVHISDLHNKMFGKNQVKLLSEVESLSPNIIVITGDLIDRRKFDLEKAMCFIDGAMKIAPIYYVSGNHEAWSGNYSDIRRNLVASGVTVLDDESVEITINDGSIELLGLSDPGFYNGSITKDMNVDNVDVYLNGWSEADGFKILLSHRPELFELYCDNNIDLTFAGHAHGGQFRIPFIGAIFAPDQGFLPEFTSGGYAKDSSTMFVSRGLGNSIIPIRIFNRPEIIAVTLNQCVICQGSCRMCSAISSL